MKIVINPGHAPNGNPDPGAVNNNTGLRECDVALSIGKKLGTCILNQMLGSIKLVDRGVKNAVPGKNGLYVLKYTDCPAVLVEAAFISNAEDERLLANPEMQDQFARSIARGVTDYVGGR